MKNCHSLKSFNRWSQPSYYVKLTDLSSQQIAIRWSTNYYLQSPSPQAHIYPWNSMSSLTHSNIHLYIKTMCLLKKTTFYRSPGVYSPCCGMVPAYKDHLSTKNIFCLSLEWSLYVSFTVFIHVNMFSELSISSSIQCSAWCKTCIEACYTDYPWRRCYLCTYGLYHK